MKIIERIDAIKKIGTNRQLYNEQWRKTKNLLMDYGKEAGLKVYEDILGNVFCRLEGYDDSRTIAIISHYDSVENGGAYDGIVGVLAGLEVVSLLQEKGEKPDISIEVICIAEEEGARFKTTFLGSRLLTGELNYEKVIHLQDERGMNFFDARQEVNLPPFDEEALVKAQRKDIIYALELHIEQSRYLDEVHIPIGICNRIPGQMKINMTIIGEANHAGTTSMFERKDALCCAAKIISFVEYLGIKHEGVTTTGYSMNDKNRTNVIPSRVELIHDMRHQDPDVFEQMLVELTDYARKEEEKRGVQITFEKLVKIPPALMSETVMEQITYGSKKLGLESMTLKSGAGHDVQVLANAGIACGLIFIPSVGGISHREEEYSREEDIIKGVKTLWMTVKTLAYDSML